MANGGTPERLGIAEPDKFRRPLTTPEMDALARRHHKVPAETAVTGEQVMTVVKLYELSFR